MSAVGLGRVDDASVGYAGRAPSLVEGLSAGVNASLVAPGAPATDLHRMRVGIVMLTPDVTMRKPQTCLAALERSTRGMNVQVEVVQDSGPGFSFSRSINRGMARVPDADAWVLLNDDCYMDDGWLHAMLDTVRQNPRVGVVGAVLRFPDDRGLQHAGGWIALDWAREYFRHAMNVRAPFWAVRQLAKERTHRFPWMFGHYKTVDPSHRLDFITGACQLVTRACRDAVGEYDERFVMGGEDIDYSIRALAEGFELALATGATGLHEEGASTGHMSAQKVASVRAFQDKWSAGVLHALTRGSARTGVYHNASFSENAPVLAPGLMDDRAPST